MYEEKQLYKDKKGLTPNNPNNKYDGKISEEHARKLKEFMDLI